MRSEGRDTISNYKDITTFSFLISHLFWKGFVTGAVATLVLVLVVMAFRLFHNRDKKLYETWEQMNEVQEIREDMLERDPYEFLDEPGVRRAADDAAGEFRRKRDAAVRRIREHENGE